MGPIHPDGWHNSCICKLGKFGKLDILYVGKRLRRESGMMLHELSCFDLQPIKIKGYCCSRSVALRANRY